MRRAVKLYALLVCLGCRKEPGPPQPLAGEGKPEAPHIEIALPEGSPKLDPIESGTYVLATSLEFESGKEHSERQACEVSVKGESIEIVLQRAGVDPIRGTLKGGRLRARGREGEGTYDLEGQVTAAGRLAGVVQGGVPGQVTIRGGRWALERIK